MHDHRILIAAGAAALIIAIMITMVALVIRHYQSQERQLEADYEAEYRALARGIPLGEEDDPIHVGPSRENWEEATDVYRFQPNTQPPFTGPVIDEPDTVLIGAIADIPPAADPEATQLWEPDFVTARQRRTSGWQHAGSWRAPADLMAAAGPGSWLYNLLRSAEVMHVPAAIAAPAPAAVKAAPRKRRARQATA